MTHRYEINLVHKLNSTCKFTLDVYPDTQVSATIPAIDPDGIYTIKSRFSSYQDLFKILAVNQVLKDFGVKKRILYCPYILAARSDRKFKSGQSFDLKLVTNVLNSCEFDEIQIVDPHSDVLPALLNNSKVIDAFDGFLSWISFHKFDWGNRVLISPDAGAYKKIFHIAEKLKLNVISGNKVRTFESGKSSTPFIEFHGDVKDRDCVIIDDICDGGRTFINLGEQLKNLGAETVTLCVTHGIFSSGIELKNIDKIFTTNSFKSFLETEISDKFQVINIF